MHTPGPWHIDETGICAPNGRTLIAADAIGGESEKEVFGNALLMASAPALLAMLEQALDTIDACGSCNPKDRGRSVCGSLWFAR